MENVELNAERALLAIIHLCHVWAPMHEYTTKLGNKTIVCFIQGCFSVDWVVGSLLGKELIHSWVCQLWIPNYEKANPEEQKAFLDSSDLKKIRIFRIKPCWIAEHLTRKHWRSSVSLLLPALNVPSTPAASYHVLPEPSSSMRAAQDKVACSREPAPPSPSPSAASPPAQLVSSQQFLPQESRMLSVNLEGKKIDTKGKVRAKLKWDRIKKKIPRF